MRGTVQIGEKTVEMASNGATSLIYREVFKLDLMKEMSSGDVDPSLVERLAFIQAKQAELSKLSELVALKKEDFYEWLTQFEPTDIYIAGSEILGVYHNQKTQTSKAKKKRGQ